MTVRPLLLAIGIIGFLAFVVTGFTGTIPWQASALTAVAFLGLALNQLRDFSHREKGVPVEPEKKQPASPPPKVESKPEQETKPALDRRMARSPVPLWGVLSSAEAS